MSENPPTSNGANGDEPSGSRLGDGERAANGRFAAGNRVGRGNPLGGVVARKRTAMLKAIRRKDVRQAIATLRAIMSSPTAKDSDRLAAAREVLDRGCGKAAPADYDERIERLEESAGIKPEFDWNAYRRTAEAEKKRTS
ncbi:MAG TPA: hypothetical protein VFE47_11925 [Tepidisphaeraceae bacterium]|jgi:hypothetical protein|nr:hypothetical protein [Tepidisphaeraceae bacterium]